MTKARISEASVTELLDEYVRLSVERGRALYLCQSSAMVNRLGDRIFDISDELKRRPGDQWSALIELFGHPDMYVRFNAATSLIGIVPGQARQVIQDIADARVFPLAGHAGMYLSMYDGEAAKLLKP